MVYPGSVDVKNLNIVNLDEGKILGILYGRVVDRLNSFDVDLRRIANTISAVFAALALSCGVLSLPFSIFGSIFYFGVGGFSLGVNIALRIKPLNIPDKNEPKKANSIETVKEVLQGIPMQLQEIEMSLADLLDSNKAEIVLRGCTNPVMRVKDQNAFVIRYFQYALYTNTWGNFTIMGKKQETFVVIYQANNAYIENKNLIISNNEFYPSTLTSIFKKEMCLIPGKNILVRFPQA